MNKLKILQISKAKLNFNHPCKELIWFLTNTDNNTNNWFNYTTIANNVADTDYSSAAFKNKLSYYGVTGNNNEFRKWPDGD